MLDAFVIEEIRRRERERGREDRPAVELPLPVPEPGEKDEPGDGKKDDRGVVIIDYG
jgi:hypothetical protein